MYNIRHILRLHTQHQTTSEIVMQTGIPRSVLKKCREEFNESGLSFEEINELSDIDLAELFTKPEEPPISETMQILLNLFPSIDKELRRRGVTRKLLWEEYRKKYPDGVSRQEFNKHFCKWKRRIVPIMHNGAHRLELKGESMRKKNLVETEKIKSKGTPKMLLQVDKD